LNIFAIYLPNLFSGFSSFCFVASLLRVKTTYRFEFAPFLPLGASSRFDNFYHSPRDHSRMGSLQMIREISHLRSSVARCRELADFEMLTPLRLAQRTQR
jgi:hypothetical protein